MAPVQQQHTGHDHHGGILAALDAEQFQRCFVAWVAALIGAPAGMIDLRLCADTAPVKTRLARGAR
jgi:hypothetical protein